MAARSTIRGWWRALASEVRKHGLRAVAEQQHRIAANRLANYRQGVGGNSGVDRRSQRRRSGDGVEFVVDAQRRTDCRHQPTGGERINLDAVQRLLQGEVDELLLALRAAEIRCRVLVPFLVLAE